MTTLDEWLAQLGSGWLFVLVLAAVLGLRHASDPDHLTALLTLRLKERQRSPHLLGLAWGTGHALTMVPYTPLGAVAVGWDDAVNKHFAYRLTADVVFTTGTEANSDPRIRNTMSAAKAPTMKISPWAKLIMPMMP